MGDMIRVSIGTEPQQLVPCEVLRSSIVRRTRRELEFTYSWHTLTGWHQIMESAPRIKRGTKFSTWRWLVPQAMSYEGKAIYLDADQVCLCDIAELWDSLTFYAKKPPYCLAMPAVAAMVRNAVGVFGKKVPEPNKWQSSVMVMDCGEIGRTADSMLALTASGTMSYRDLMQAEWLNQDRIIELDPGWNHFGIHTPSTKILHWSHVASQPYRNPSHPTAWVFESELRASLEAGHVSPALVLEEIERGHLHRHWASVARARD